MNKYTFEKEAYLRRLNELKSYGYPDCAEVSLSKAEVNNLKIGTACYVVSNAGVHLRMYVGKDMRDCNKVKIIFAGTTGSFAYNTDNIGKTYNVFLAKL